MAKSSRSTSALFGVPRMIKHIEMICGQHSDGAASHIDPTHNAMTKIALTNSANQFA